MLDRGRFSVFVIILQIVFIILFGVFVRYTKLALPEKVTNETSVESSEKHGYDSKVEVASFYPCK